MGRRHRDLQSPIGRNKGPPGNWTRLWKFTISVRNPPSSFMAANKDSYGSLNRIFSQDDHHFAHLSGNQDEDITDPARNSFSQVNITDQCMSGRSQPETSSNTNNRNLSSYPTTEQHSAISTKTDHHQAAQLASVHSSPEADRRRIHWSSSVQTGSIAENQFQFG